MTDLLRRVRAYVDQHKMLAPGAKVVVGVSGGPDSLCLLHLLNRLRVETPLSLHVAHLDHGLRGEASEEDAALVSEIARSWDLPCTTERLPAGSLDVPGLSLEEAARNARYAFLARVAHRNRAGFVAVGHNADDQAETVLMHFLRGSGVRGLRGMLPVTPLTACRLGAPAVESAELHLIRPLLCVFRADIEAYCVEHALRPRQDATNADQTLFRNRLRHELLPLLEGYNPAIRSVLTHTADAMAGDAAVLQDALRVVWENAVMLEEHGVIHFDLSTWRALPLGLQRALLREAIGRLRSHLRNIDWQHVERGVRLARRGVAGQSATLAGGLALHVRYDRLIAGPESLEGVTTTPQVGQPTALAAPGVTDLPGGWHVEVNLLERAAFAADFEANSDPWNAMLDADSVGDQLLLRPRVAGDRFQPQGLAGRSSRINEFMINAKVAREFRAKWPVLEGVAGVAWLCGLRIDERALVTHSTARGWHVRFYRE